MVPLDASTCGRCTAGPCSCPPPRFEDVLEQDDVGVMGVATFLTFPVMVCVAMVLDVPARLRGSLRHLATLARFPC
jgi:hypothetical protein